MKRYDDFSKEQLIELVEELEEQVKLLENESSHKNKIVESLTNLL